MISDGGGTEMDWLQPLVSLISGGLAGAAVNAFITARKQRLEISLKIIEEFFSFYDDIGKVKGTFTEPQIANVLDDPANLNRLRRIGDWFHYVASLYKENTVEKKLLAKVGVIKELNNFRESVLAAKGRVPRHLGDAWSWWENLESFKSN
jgi:hypothetical protein